MALAPSALRRPLRLCWVERRSPGWAEGTHLPGGLLGVRQAGHTRTPATLGQTGAFEGLILSPSLAAGAERSLQHHKTQNILQEFLPVALR